VLGPGLKNFTAAKSSPLFRIYSKEKIYSRPGKKNGFTDVQFAIKDMEDVVPRHKMDF